MPTVDKALALAALGFAVIPLNGKVPRTAHGVKDATTDPDTIRKMFGNLECNIGARVPEHLLVLDFDKRNGGSPDALEARAGTGLPHTLAVETGSEGGLHLYYIRPEGKLTSRNLPPGIDLKISTGYMVMPGSTHPVTGKPYSWKNTQPPRGLPRQIVGLIVEPPHRVNLEAVRRKPTSNGLKALVREARYSVIGTRNDMVFWALCASYRGGYSDLDRELIIAAGLEAGLSMHEVINAHRSAKQRENA